MSIKRKFVTAITTAGLLAGLFGSAFVPSALAVRTIDADESYAFIEDGYDGDDAGDGYIGVSSNYSDGSFADCVNFSADCALPTRLQISSYVDYGFQIEGNNIDDKEYGSTEETYGDDFSIGFYLQDDEGDPVESADLSATVTGGKIKVAFAYLEDETERVRCYNPELRSEFSTTGDRVNDVVSDGGTDDTLTAGDTAGEYYLCFKAVSKSTLGVSNVVIKADGVTIWSGSVQVIGDADSISLTTQNGYTNVSANNAGFENFFKVVVEDAAGQAIVGTKDGFYNYVDETLFGGTDLEYYSRGASSEDLFAGISVGADGIGVDLAANVCVDADAGDQIATALKLTNYEGDRVTSNSLSILCTGDADEYVVTGAVQQVSTTPATTITGPADWAASATGLADATGQIDIYAIIEDQDGRPMGVDGSSGFNLDTYSIDGNEDLAINETDGDFVIAGGKYLIGGYVPDMSMAAKWAIEITFDDPDSFAGSALVVEVFYVVNSYDMDYTLTRVRNASKTSATWTADWGLDCSNAVVYFDWVNKNGTKGTLATGVSPIARRANFNGVATFTLKKRNMTIYVTAYACDDFSDSPDELGPVKARFR